MSTATMTLRKRLPSQYELRFLSLRDEGCAYTFPCDASGHVNLDALSDKARDMYIYARLVVGRVFSRPTVQSTVH